MKKYREKVKKSVSLRPEQYHFGCWNRWFRCYFY